MPAPYNMHTDHMAHFVPPSGTQAAARNPYKFDALARTGGWAPHTSNKPGAQRAVYDPVSHKSTLYTFDSAGDVTWTEGNGDKIMRDKAKEIAQSGDKWHGRRKGVVEFVDRTHPSAVNQNDEYLAWCARNEHAYHTPTGELTKWMDNAKPWFLDDVTVSRRHAEFRRGAEGWSVRDVGSLNGTYVNRVRVDDQRLMGGEEVQVGKFRFVFLVGVEPGT